MRWGSFEFWVWVKLGLLAGKASFSIKDDFKISDNKFLSV